MEFAVKDKKSEDLRTNCVVVGIFEPKRLSDSGKQLDELSKQYISKIIRKGDIEGKIGQTLLLHSVPNILAERILLVGCGKPSELTDRKYIQIISSAANALKNTGIKTTVSQLAEIPVKDRNLNWKTRQHVEGFHDALYLFNELKSKKDDKQSSLKKITITVNGRKEVSTGKQAVQEGTAIGNGVKLAKDLGNLPGNICTPTYLANQAKAIKKGNSKIKVEVLEEAEMKKLGMGALLSVSKGSRQPAKLIVIKYSGAKAKDKPFVLVGKGLTFDAGGISLKPAQTMDEMKYDMCGSASVLGTLTAVSQLQLPINVIGIIPSSENMPDGDANKPGDIVTSMSGQTIEILNTDAEGRLILCDALSYAERFEPATVIDIATLTGACVIALGQHATGMFSNNTSLGNALENAANTSSDRIWELPLWDDYQPQLKSNFADMANIGGREAGTVTAACFLSRFTKKYKWAHLDIAGTAWKSGVEKGSTGRPVPLLTQYLIDVSKKKK
jgi:leucyl aminopeptidase